MPQDPHARRSIACIANSAATLRMSVKPGLAGLARSSSMRRGSVFNAPTHASISGAGASPSAAIQAPPSMPVAPLRNALERLLLRLDGSLRRFQIVAMVPGARVLACEKNVQTGAYEVTSGLGAVPFSSPHDFEIVEHLIREVTPHSAEDPCVVSCMCWQRGLPAQGYHDVFYIPLLTGDAGPHVQVSDNLTRPVMRNGDLVYVGPDLTEVAGTQSVAVAFDPSTLYDLCTSLAEKTSNPDGTTGVGMMLPCSPSTGRRFQPWRDVRWLPTDRATGVTSLAKRFLFGAR